MVSRSLSDATATHIAAVSAQTYLAFWMPDPIETDYMCLYVECGCVANVVVVQEVDANTECECLAPLHEYKLGLIFIKSEFEMLFFIIIIIAYIR